MKPLKRPVLRYFGAKWRLADWIIGHFPQHRIYVEPFGGSAAVLLRKRPSEIEVYNDLNGHIVNFFRVLRQRPEELIRLLELTPYARQEFNECVDLTHPNELERARRFYVRSFQGRGFFGNGEGFNTWRIQARVDKKGHCHQLPQTWLVPENLRAAAMRLRQAQIECLDALEIISRYDSPETLLYVDPPYVHATRTSGRYAHDLDDAGQQALARSLNACAGMVVLSGYRSPEYDEWYRGWRRVDKLAFTNAVNHQTERATAVESLWINPAAARILPILF